MKLLKETIEMRADSENEAKEVIESYRKNSVEKGYTIGAAGYTVKTKKSKGEIIDTAFIVKIIMVHGSIWEEV